MVKIERGKRIATVAGLLVAIVLMLSIYVQRRRLVSWRRFEPMGKNEQGYREYRHRHTGVVFVALPAGTFLMGSPETEQGREVNEGPLHEVTLSAFMIAKYEVNVTDWVRIRGYGPPLAWQKDLPVSRVSWEECQRFCDETGLALPSEAQWEYACRAGTSGPFAGKGKLEEMGWGYDDDANLHPPGQKEPNDFGLYDMHGNVAEWCADVYDADFYSKTEASRDNPVCLEGSEDRVLRGGECASGWDGRSASRCGASPYRRFIAIGFRPVAPSMP